MIYQWKTGFRANVPAQIAGERLTQLSEGLGRHVTAAEVVEDARPEDAPLHPCFEWDDEAAAERYREDQARRIIRSVYPVHLDADGAERPVLGFVHVDLPDVGPCYVTTARAMSEPELAEQVEQEALASLEAWRRRYAHIRTLGPIFRAIDRVNAGRRPRKKAKRELVVQP